MPRIRTWLLICCLSYLPSDVVLMSRAISPAHGTRPPLPLPPTNPRPHRSPVWIALQVPGVRLLYAFLVLTRLQPRIGFAPALAADNYPQGSGPSPVCPAAAQFHPPYLIPPSAPHEIHVSAQQHKCFVDGDPC